MALFSKLRYKFTLFDHQISINWHRLIVVVLLGLGIASLLPWNAGVMAAALVVLAGMLIGIVVLQQLQLRRLQRKVRFLERQAQVLRKQQPVLPAESAKTTIYTDIDRFFHQGQTKH